MIWSLLGFKLVFCRKPPWPVAVGVASISAPAVCFLISSRVGCTATPQSVRQLSATTEKEKMRQQLVNFIQSASSDWSDVQRSASHVVVNATSSSVSSPDDLSSPSPSWSSPGSVVVPSGMEVFVGVLPVGLPHVSVGSTHITISLSNWKRNNLRLYW